MRCQKVYSEKKSFDNVISPEQLNDYVRVAGISVWLIVICIILILEGFCIWGVFGSLVTRLEVGAYCKEFINSGGNNT